MNVTFHSTCFRRLAVAVAGLLCLVTSQLVTAGPFERGVIAYQNKEFKRAHDMWLPLAEHGHVLAQTLLGALYAYGEGVERNDAEAAKWFERAADAGSAQAQYNLGILYENGWGVEKNLIRARYWYRKAADQGRKDAATRYALISDPEAEANSPDQQPAEQPAGETPPENQELMPAIPIDTPVDGQVVQPAEAGGTANISTTPDMAEWLRSQPPGNYTLQLIASTDLQSLRDNMKNLEGTGAEKYALVESRRDTKTWYGLIYGSYKTPGEAQRAMQNLPDALHHYQPWVRPFTDIKSWREQAGSTEAPDS